MDFDLTDDQLAVAELAERVFTDKATVERVKAVEQTDERFDRDLWATLATTGLLGIALPEEDGGAGCGLVEVCLVLEQQGRRVAPVPLWSHLVGAMAIAEWGSAEQRAAVLPEAVAGADVITVGLPSAPDVVPAGSVARWAVVEGQGGLRLVDLANDVEQTHGIATDRSILSTIGPGDAGEPIGPPEAADWLAERSQVALAALQVGVCEEAVTRTAAYASSREQFGRPLSTNQAVASRAADAHIDTEAIRVTMWQAAWRISEGLDAADAVSVAAWWAAHAGNRVVHATQHLHGGIGADIDYPIHRYFLWGKTIEGMLGGSGAALARIGDLVAAGARR